MQADALGPLLRLEVTADGIGDHRVQFRERISLRGDAATVARRVPARDITAGFRARRDLENDFSNRAHAGKLSAMRFGVNAAKLDLPQRRRGAAQGNKMAAVRDLSGEQFENHSLLLEICLGNLELGTANPKELGNIQPEESNTKPVPTK